MSSSSVEPWIVPLPAAGSARGPADGQAGDSPAGPLVAEMARRWQAGERPRAEEFLARLPEGARQPEAAIDLVYEEICCRQDAGEEVDPAEILGRFPQWRAELEVLLHCDRLLAVAPASPRFPGPGETLGDFRLLAELGRGLQGRVFLATQVSLADRPVVLKVTARAGHEHLSLARLQHTHIVPLYGVQDDPTRHLRLLCMPYFGGITLSRLLEAVADRSAEPGTGRAIVEALEQAEQTAPLVWPAQQRSPARAFLSQISYVQAVCWTGACLADALAYAHERGLVHLDLKPSNVLLAADGQPMLLDFHLAREPLPAGVPVSEWFGGSRPYMSPEQRAALAAASSGQDVPLPVDGRSDLFSLGMLLYEALGGVVAKGRTTSGRLPLPEPVEGLEPLRACNPQVSVGLADVIEKCLRPRPGDRYPTAAALAADLRRHLDDLPLRGVANRSLRERWRKWRRRRPHALPLGAMVLVVLTAVAASGVVAWNHLSGQVDEARAALVSGQDHLRRGRHSEAVSALQRGFDLAVNLPGHRGLAEECRTQLQRARDAQAAAEVARLAPQLQRQADHIRFYSSFDDLSPASLEKLETLCRTWWDRRDRIPELLESAGDPETTQSLKNDWLDLALIWADLHVRRAGATPAARREALEVLDEAEALLGPSPVLDWERERQRGEPVPSGFDGSSPPPPNSWEHLVLGRALFRAGNFDGAFGQLERAVALQPQGLWQNFYRGLCADRLGRREDALLAFTACVALAPESAVCRYNRGLAYHRLSRAEAALVDYDSALELEPSLAPAALNRGILSLEAGRFPEAAADFRRALRDGADPAAVHYNLALVYWNQGDRSQARVCVQEALRHQPGHDEARALAERLGREP